MKKCNQQTITFAKQEICTNFVRAFEEESLLSNITFQQWIHKLGRGGPRKISTRMASVTSL